MSSFGRLTGFGLKGKESVNAPFSAEQLTIKSRAASNCRSQPERYLAKLQKSRLTYFRLLPVSGKLKTVHMHRLPQKPRQEPTVGNPH